MLTAAPVTVISGLAEMARPAGWYEDFDSLVAQALATPDRSAAPGWETAASTLGASPARLIESQQSMKEKF